MLLSGRAQGRRPAALIIAIGLCFSAASSSSDRVAAAGTQPGGAAVPPWLFPLNPAASGNAAEYDRARPVHVPLSDVTFTEWQLNDLFAAPDWRPQSHSTMPDVVAHGRAPEMYACGFCHTPSGQGRPENASLAGLPASYIVQQVNDFKSGARRSAWSGPYRPADLMIKVAANATTDEVASAAEYFSQQIPKSHVQVLERALAPRSRVVGWVYVAIPGGGCEPLGTRLLEFAPDAARHEHRDDDLEYVAYVPPGSLRRGNSLATGGVSGSTVACVSCHGDRLQGVGAIPRLAGRSPTYLLRQLLAFRTGARDGAAGRPMAAVAAELDLGAMIDAAAYAASLESTGTASRHADFISRCE
jgi:cytochrome c553